MIGVRLPKDQSQRLRSAAREHRTSMSDLVRQFTEEGLERVEREIAEACGVEWEPPPHDWPPGGGNSS